MTTRSSAPQAEQEIYLPAFQAAVQQGAASSVMCSYSTINGTAACQNPYTLSTVLRQQFGYTGFVTSDWGATHSTAASANAGLDMDMPGNDGYYGTALVNAVNSGSVSTATINSAVSDDLDPDVRASACSTRRRAGRRRRSRRTPPTRATRRSWPKRARCC